MKYILIIKDEDNTLIPKLKEEGFLSILSEIGYEIEVEEGKNELFLRILASYMTINHMVDILKKEVQVRGKGPEDINQALEWGGSYITSSTYFQKNTLVLIKDHFRTSDKLNFDSFKLFNLRGMKPEIIKLYEESLKGPDIDEILRSMGISESDVLQEGDFFETIKELVVQKGVDLSKFEEFHIYPVDGDIMIKDNRGTVISDVFVSEELGMFFDFTHIGTTEENLSGLNSILHLILMLNVFEVENVVIHKGIEDTLNTKMLEFITSMTKYSDSITHCNGCKDCE